MAYLVRKQQQKNSLRWNNWYNL